MVVDKPTINKGFIYFNLLFMKKLVSIGEKKIFFHISKIWTFEIFKTIPKDDWCGYPPYTVRVNWSQEPFFFDWEKFYMDYTNVESTLASLEEHKKEIAEMEEAGKTEEEIQKAMEWKWINFEDRIEYIIDCEGIQELIKKWIETLK